MFQEFSFINFTITVVEPGLKIIEKNLKAYIGFQSSPFSKVNHFKLVYYYYFSFLCEDSYAQGRVYVCENINFSQIESSIDAVFYSLLLSLTNTHSTLFLHQHIYINICLLKIM